MLAALAASPVGTVGGVVSVGPVVRLRSSTSKLGPAAAPACWYTRNAMESPLAAAVYATSGNACQAAVAVAHCSPCPWPALLALYSFTRRQITCPGVALRNIPSAT